MTRTRLIALGWWAAAHVAGAAAPSALRAQGEDVIGLPVGATPPAALIEDLDGRPVNLSEYIGRKPVLFEFWATWCPICERLLPRMEAAARRFSAQVEFVVVAVAVNQSKQAIRRHMERHPMPFRYLWDTNGNATRAFQAPSTSYVVVLDARGRVAYTGIGDDQDIEAAVGRVAGR